MEKNNNNLILFFLLPLLLSFHSINADENSQLKTYIIHVKYPTENKLFAHSIDLVKQFHQSFIPTEIESSAETRILYSYKNTINGFATRLTEKEVQDMSTKDGFLSAHADQILTLETTHTPTFLGLVQNQTGVGGWRGLGGGDGTIIGLLDTGVFPDHPSFSGEGMPPPPAKWKGRCDFNASQCNNKLIGAKTFISSAMSTKARVPPVDDFGHGTHTASTAAGAMVENAQVLGNAKGVAVGMAPRAHLAIYKICGLSSCYLSDCLAGIDEAIEDGVDVLSISLGGFYPISYFHDFIAISTFKAMAKGIFVSCAAGNGGPYAGTIMNNAPWYLTVAASTIDRQIQVNIKLGNGLELPSQSLYQPNNFTKEELPIVYPGFNKIKNAAFCGNGSLEGLDVIGKVVVCDLGGYNTSLELMVEIVKAAGGVAMILTGLANSGHDTFSNNVAFPISSVSYFTAFKIKAYIASTRNPTTIIYFKGTVLRTSPAPAIAYFSSRGPNIKSPGILKPDITGPGVDILAAVPFDIGMSTSNHFAMMSGTSMSTPHLAGIAALIKSAHPDWSISAIKSAIMTTAYTIDRSGSPIVDERLLRANHFAIGAGHVDPVKVIHPGLIYDLNVEDYISYLCSLNYNNSQVILITGRYIDCAKVKSITDSDLNLPSISVLLGPYNKKVTVWRTVKNVGKPRSIYRVKVDAPKGITVNIEPNKLQFFTIGEKKKYAVTFIHSENVTFIDREGETGTVDGQLKWISKKYEVRSPITVTLQKP